MDSTDEPVQLTAFMCGPNRECQHVFDAQEPMYDEAGQECGMTCVCPKCGTSAFDLSLWGD